MTLSNFVKNNRWIYMVMFALTMLVLMWALPLWKCVWAIAVIAGTLILDFLDYKEKALDKEETTHKVFSMLFPISQRVTISRYDDFISVTAEVVRGKNENGVKKILFLSVKIGGDNLEFYQNFEIQENADFEWFVKKISALKKSLEVEC